MALTIEHLRTLIQEHDDFPNIDVEKFIYPDGNYHYNVSLIDSGLNTVIDFTLDENTFQSLELKVTKETYERPYTMSMMGEETWVHIFKEYKPELDEWTVNIAIVEGGGFEGVSSDIIGSITVHSKKDPQVEHMDFT